MNVMTEVIAITNLAATAQNIAIGGRKFMISNTGANPLYFNPKETATAANGFLVPAGTTLQPVLTCMGNLSVISTGSKTNVAVLILK